jgi:cytochrome c peroxidase
MFLSKSRKMSNRMGFIGLILLFSIFSCTNEDMVEVQTDPLASPIRPDHFPPAHYEFGANTYSKKGFELGRKLFFDPIISIDSTISCSSCHRQKDAFADRGKALSTGVFGQSSDRNSPPIVNMAWKTSFMWDGGVNHIEIVPFAPIIHPKEMGEDLKNVIAKLRNHPEYPDLFEDVFERAPIDDQQFFWALAQYMANLVSANSKYDQYLRGETQLTDAELRGLSLFRENCASCHQEPLLTDNAFHNNGLDTAFEDKGRYIITLDDGDLGKFKTPTLRNIMLTGPYMHDGRFEHIEDVLKHYSAGIKSSNTLSLLLSDHVGGIAMSEVEKGDLTSFLATLTDHHFISDPELSE